MCNSKIADRFCIKQSNLFGLEQLLKVPSKSLAVSWTFLPTIYGGKMVRLTLYRYLLEEKDGFLRESNFDEGSHRTLCRHGFGSLFSKSKCICWVILYRTKTFPWIIRSCKMNILDIYEWDALMGISDSLAKYFILYKRKFIKSMLGILLLE